MRGDVTVEGERSWNHVCMHVCVVEVERCIIV